MTGHKYTVSSLAELCRKIEKIEDKRNMNSGHPLWFRGQESSDYCLLPTLLRKDRDRDLVNSDQTYSTVNLREDYRLQTFKARVFHLTNPMPSNRLEWQALYQHHFGSTRLLDWSESVWIALSFALEAFLDARDSADFRMKRSSATPVIWVLDPVMLNRKVYTYFCQSDKLHKTALKTMDFSEKELDEFSSHINEGGLYHQVSDSSGMRMGGIINLGVLDEYRQHHMAEMKGMLLSGEYNPFFYLCMRYYGDALPVCIDQNGEDNLPPLAVLHQYQSERIRSQRGTFTVFPNYFLPKGSEWNSLFEYDCRRMECQPFISDCIYEIRLLNPQKIAKELMLLGSRQTELYPESDYYARSMEAEQYFV